jgi:hypothetical protein
VGGGEAVGAPPRPLMDDSVAGGEWAELEREGRGRVRRDTAEEGAP